MQSDWQKSTVIARSSSLEYVCSGMNLYLHCSLIHFIPYTGLTSRPLQLGSCNLMVCRGWLVQPVLRTRVYLFWGGIFIYHFPLYLHTLNCYKGGTGPPLQNHSPPCRGDLVSPVLRIWVCLYRGLSYI